MARLASKMTGGRLPDYGRTLEVFSETATVDATAIERDLGVHYREPYRGLVESVGISTEE